MGLIGGLILAALVGAGLVFSWWWLMVRPRPQCRGTLVVAGLRAELTIHRDARGVPHIRASSLEDAVLGQGLVHGQDRLWQLELQRRSAHGRLSELFGARALPADRFLRHLGLTQAAQRERLQLREDERLLLEAYAAGVNAAITVAEGRLPLELRLLGVRPEPWTIVDSLAIAKLMALELGSNLDAELVRARIIDAIGVERALILEHADLVASSQLEPSGEWRAVVAQAARLYGAAIAELPSVGGGGSNAWAVSGARTVSGRPLLASDPHLTLGLPALWHEAHLVTPETDVYGAALPGTPGVVMGHTTHLAWGMTNAYADCQDLYLERLDPDGSRCAFMGAWETLTVRDEVIRIRDGGSVTERCRESRHGPLIAQLGGHAVALRWTALDSGHGFAALRDLMTARNLSNAQDALAQWHAPAQNVVLAATDGRIAGLMAGAIPRRGGACGPLPVPGWSGEHEWSGYLSAAELPQSIDPADGVVVSANQRPPQVAVNLGWDFPAGHRAERIRERIDEPGPIDGERMAAIQLDVRSLPGRLFRDTLVHFTPRHPAQAQLLRTLLDWDGELGRSSTGAAVYEVGVVCLLRVTLAPLLGEALLAQLMGTPPLNPLSGSSMLLGRWTGWLVRALAARDATILNLIGRDSWDDLVAEALDAAADELRRRCGPPARWQWGRLHRLTLAHPLAQLPLVGRLFGRRRFAMPGDADTPLQSAPRGGIGWEAAGPAPSWRQVVDLAQRERSRSVLPGGQWGLPFSRHYLDQLASWSRGELLPQHLGAGTVAGDGPPGLHLRPPMPQVPTARPSPSPSSPPPSPTPP